MSPEDNHLPQDHQEQVGGSLPRRVSPAETFEPKLLLEEDGCTADQPLFRRGDQQQFTPDDVDAVFDWLMAQVGTDGRFQRLFNMNYNLVFCVAAAMPYLNIVLALTVPDHWCLVPGRELTNLTAHQWKELTIPREGDSFSKCEMYDFNVSSADWPTTLPSSSTNRTTGCSHGWQFDETWYSLTAPSQQSWVCQDALLVSNLFAISRAADVIGCFVFGQLADAVGRRPVFYMTLAAMFSGRVLCAFASASYGLFAVAVMVGSLSITSTFQSPLAIGLEVTSSDRRAHLAMLQCLGWTLGLCLTPLVAWVARDWRLLMVLTSLPCLPYFFMCRYFPESPRWLAARGHSGRALACLRRLAGINGRSLPPEAEEALVGLAKRKERVYGIASLLSSFRLASYTAFISICWIVNTLTYYTLVLTVGTMSGNPFINFLWQSVVELPAYLLGRRLSDTLGRRWTQAGFFLLQAVAFLALIPIITEAGLSWLATALVVFGKLCVTITYYVVYLQAMETFPTCIRQTGTAFASLLGSAVGICGPYVVYLGTAVDARLPHIIMALLSVVGMVAAAALPETLHQRLPETLADVVAFGSGQRFWSLRPPPAPTEHKTKNIT